MKILKRQVNLSVRSSAKPDSLAASGAGWTFLTNHSHVLILLAREPGLRLRDVASRVGITERAVQRIVADLEEAAILTRSRDGRCNRYEVHSAQPLRHVIEGHRTVGDLLKIVGME
ncbi:MAG TPA: MarR family transcriptional regulator [Abditibacteriaceae bacterium]|jgi:DNA-binding MarR family transcriptional regulator